IHEAVRKLGYERARVVGHDIGLMVAYAYAAMYPTEGGAAHVDGRLPARHRRMEGHLRCPLALAFSLLRAHARAAGEGQGADLLRAFLERLRRRSEALDPGGGPWRLHQGLRTAGTDGRRVRLLRLVSEDGRRLRRARQDQASDAGDVDRRRESEW